VKKRSPVPENTDQPLESFYSGTSPGPRTSTETESNPLNKVTVSLKPKSSAGDGCKARQNESNSNIDVLFDTDLLQRTIPQSVEKGSENAESNAACDDEKPEWKTQVRNLLVDLEQPELVPKIISMMKKHSAMWSGKIGEITATEHGINLKPESVPTRQLPYRAGHKSRELISEQVERMRQADVIEPAQSEWASPVFVVTNKDGSPRFCVDYRKLNAVTIRDSYPIPRMDDCIDSLGTAKIFTTLDCNSGYWQIPIATEDKDKATVISHAGAWQFKRMPFGLTNAPATFQRALDILLAGVKWQFCLVYFDDVIVFSRTEKEHIAHASVFPEVNAAIHFC